MKIVTTVTVLHDPLAASTYLHAVINHLEVAPAGQPFEREIWSCQRELLWQDEHATGVQAFMRHATEHCIQRARLHTLDYAALNARTAAEVAAAAETAALVRRLRPAR